MHGLPAIVHLLDLTDNRFSAPEAVTVGHVIDGLQRAHGNDDTLLSQGMALLRFTTLAMPSAQCRSPGRRRRVHSNLSGHGGRCVHYAGSVCGGVEDRCHRWCAAAT